MADTTEQQLQEVSNMLQRKAPRWARKKAYQESYDKLPDWAKTANDVLIGDYNKNITDSDFEDKDFVTQWEEAFENPGVLTAIPNAYGHAVKFLTNWGDPGNWGSWRERVKYEPLFHKRDKNGNLHLHVDTVGDTVAKLLFGEKPEKDILGLEDLEAGLEKYGAGGGASGSNPVALPGLGAMPELPNVDWQAIRDRINNINVDANYEAPQRDPLVALGDFLANIDLTSNLSGDWSKASNKMVEFQKYNEEQEKAAKNRTADKKAELELWKAMKDVAIQEAAANHAMRNAEFGLRWQQAKMNAALAQAKANAFYNTSGPGSEYTDPAYREGRRIAAMALIENPDLTEKDIMKSLTLANAKFKRQPKQNPNFQLGYTDAMMEGIKELKERNK